MAALPTFDPLLAMVVLGVPRFVVIPFLVDVLIGGLAFGPACHLLYRNPTLGHGDRHLYLSLVLIFHAHFLLFRIQSKPV